MTPSTPSPNPEGGNVPGALYVAWAPRHTEAIAAPVVAAGAVGIVAVIAAVFSSPGGSVGGFGGKIRDLLPEGAKEWLEEYLSQRKKPVALQKTGSPFVPTKPEFLAYGVSLVALTVAFSYVKAPDLSSFILVLPTILATAVIVEVLRKYVTEVYARAKGVWAEHRIWYTGLAMFLITTFAFGVPFSSPSRNVYHSPKLTKRLNAHVSAVTVLVTLGFAAVFLGLLMAGFGLIGGTGLAMCLIMSLVDMLPVEPMNGKDIFSYKKKYWALLFAATLTLYVAWLVFL
jgi:hypothetical protein